LHLKKQRFSQTLSLDENKLYFIYGDLHLKSLEEAESNFRVKLFKNTSLREIKGGTDAGVDKDIL